ncbi:MAG TPA: diadenylate cyclase [Syntrophales bacterium]|nr:diadenylate cyclase [Syntrophales bacterium]
MKDINKIILDHACHIADEVKAKALMLYTDAVSELHITKNEKPCFNLVLVTRGEEELAEELNNLGTVINVPDVNLSRLGQVKIAITKGIAAGIFKKGDKLVCISGLPKLGYVDSIFMIDVGKEFEVLTSQNITDITQVVHPEVFSETLNIVLELAAQGREGRKVGCIFVLGDHEKVLQLSRQMVINPFLGYTEEERNILNPDLIETIKEFSAIDGAFVIKDNGAIVTAGRHLNAAMESKDFPQGLGSRHIAAAGITDITNAIAIVLSESTGNVSVFKNGKLFVSILKPIP